MTLKDVVIFGLTIILTFSFTWSIVEYQISESNHSFSEYHEKKIELEKEMCNVYLFWGANGTEIQGDGDFTNCRSNIVEKASNQSAITSLWDNKSNDTYVWSLGIGLIALLVIVAMVIYIRLKEEPK